MPAFTHLACATTAIMSIQIYLHLLFLESDHSPLAGCNSQLIFASEYFRSAHIDFIIQESIYSLVINQDDKTSKARREASPTRRIYWERPTGWRRA